MLLVSVVHSPFVLSRSRLRSRLCLSFVRLSSPSSPPKTTHSFTMPHVNHLQHFQQRAADMHIHARAIASAAPSVSAQETKSTAAPAHATTGVNKTQLGISIAAVVVALVVVGEYFSPCRKARFISLPISSTNNRRNPIRPPNQTPEQEQSIPSGWEREREDPMDRPRQGGPVPPSLLWPLGRETKSRVHCGAYYHL